MFAGKPFPFDFFHEKYVTVPVCNDVAGTRELPLTVSDKFVNPWAFKNMDRDAVFVYNHSQNSVWMNAGLCQEWFLTQFVPAVEKYLESKNLLQKAILLLVIIECLKRRYRKQRLVSEISICWNQKPPT